MDCSRIIHSRIACIGILFTVVLGLNDPAMAASLDTRKLPQQSDLNTSVNLSYGQSADAWSTVSGIKAAQGNLEQINDLLRRKYGTYEEAFSVLDVKIDGISGLDASPIARRFWLDLRAEGDGYGLVRNPVVPELHANAVLAGIAVFGIRDDWFDSHVHSRFGLLGGSGYEKRVDAFSTDLIDKLPVRDGHLYLYGMEQELTAHADTNGFLINPRLYMHEIEFVTAVEPSALDVVQGQSYFAFRWKLQTDVKHDVELSIADRSKLGFVAVAGPQPLPVDLLPMVWDYSHRLESFSEIGTMIGGGANLDLQWNRSTKLNTVGGFFGGYWGAESSLAYRSFHLDVGTWGIEASSAYRALGQRIWTAGLGFDF